jgi:hypothetical protein
LLASVVGARGSARGGGCWRRSLTRKGAHEKEVVCGVDARAGKTSAREGSCWRRSLAGEGAHEKEVVGGVDARASKTSAREGSCWRRSLAREGARDTEAVGVGRWRARERTRRRLLSALTCSPLSPAPLTRGTRSPALSFQPFCSALRPRTYVLPSPRIFRITDR